VGNYSKNFLMTQPQKLVVELMIYNDSLITGASHLYYKNSKYEHYKINGFFNRKDSTVYFSEDSTIAVRLGFLSSNCLGNYKMKLSYTDSSLRLFGQWRDNSKSIIRCPKTNVWLEKKINNKPQKPPPEISDSTLIPPDRNLERKSDIQSLIEVNEFEKDSIKIEVYDNGVIDNDSVSIYFNDSPVTRKAKISIEPIKFYLTLGKEQPISKIILSAESNGSIPPCTALMIITTKKKRHEVNLSSDFNSNAVVELFLKE
jgi:hypothetical protein